MTSDTVVTMNTAVVGVVLGVESIGGCGLEWLWFHWWVASGDRGCVAGED